MRWKFTDILEWHRWFAWRPVQMGNSMVWLEWVERRVDPKWPITGYSPRWEYRDVGYPR